MRHILPLVATLSLGLAAPAVAGDAKPADPLAHPGFGDLKWGASLSQVYAAHPVLKRKYRAAQARRALRAGKIVILELPVRYGDREWPAKLYVGPEGLHRVTLSREIPRGPDSPGADKILDPLFGALPPPEKTPDGRRLWKGDQTVVWVTSTRLVGAERLEITFHQASTYRPEDAGGSLDIE